MVESDNKGGLIIRYLWEKGTYCMIDMRFFNTDANSYQLWPPEKCLAIADQDKKHTYLDYYIQQRRHFFPFVAPVNGLLEVESETMLK